MSCHTRSAWAKLSLLSFSLSLLLLTVQPAAAGFTTGVINSAADVQQGSGAGWLAENLGGAATTVGSATFAAESHFTGASGPGGPAPNTAAYSDAGLNTLLNDYRYGNASLTASLPVINGTSYNLELLFFDPSFPVYQAGNRVMNVTVGGDTLSNLDVIAVGGGLGVKVDYSFVASGSSIAVSFSYASGDPNQVLNGFSLLAVPAPEPASVLLFGIGGIGMLMTIHRQKRHR